MFSIASREDDGKLMIIRDGVSLKRELDVGSESS